MRFVVCGMMALVTVACREIQPFPSSSTTITGYQLSGTVMTANGIPVDSVSVVLYFNWSLVSSTPTDTVLVIVSDSTQILEVNAYTPDLRFVSQVLLQPRIPPDTIRRIPWNGLYESGEPAPSGKYLIRYSLNNVVIKYVPVIVSGRETATTDANGRFTITNNHLPIGEVSDRYFLNGRFDGAYKVLPEIGIDLQKAGNIIQYPPIRLQRDTVTTQIFTF